MGAEKKTPIHYRPLLLSDDLEIQTLNDGILAVEMFLVEHLVVVVVVASSCWREDRLSTHPELKELLK